MTTINLIKKIMTTINLIKEIVTTINLIHIGQFHTPVIKTLMSSTFLPNFLEGKMVIDEIFPLKKFRKSNMSNLVQTMRKVALLVFPAFISDDFFFHLNFLTNVILTKFITY